MATIKLQKKIIYTGTITLKTGLHIGGTNAALNIGGPDKFVVRNPITNIPYIPGSSLKGKMRALVEIATGCVSVNQKGEAKASEDPNSVSGRLFFRCSGTGLTSSNIAKPSCRLSPIICAVFLPVFIYEAFSYTNMPPISIFQNGVDSSNRISIAGRSCMSLTVTLLISCGVERYT